MFLKINYHTSVYCLNANSILTTTITTYYYLLWLCRFHKSNYNTTGGADRSANGGWRVADTLMLVPRERVRAFALFLSCVPYAPTWTQFSLHEIADPIDGIEGGGVRALDATCRESDSAKGWNPLYSLAGRHVSQYGKDARA